MLQKFIALFKVHMIVSSCIFHIWHEHALITDDNMAEWE